jgi:hypothetical protein
MRRPLLTWWQWSLGARAEPEDDRGGAARPEPGHGAWARLQASYIVCEYNSLKQGQKVLFLFRSQIFVIQRWYGSEDPHSDPQPVLRNRDVYPGFQIPDPTFFHPGSRKRTVSIPEPGSRIRIKEFKYFNPKKTKKIGF